MDLLERDGHVLYLRDLKKLDQALKDIKKFKPTKLKHNQEMLDTIENFIDNVDNNKKRKFFPSRAVRIEPAPAWEITISLLATKSDIVLLSI